MRLLTVYRLLCVLCNNNEVVCHIRGAVWCSRTGLYMEWLHNIIIQERGEIESKSEKERVSVWGRREREREEREREWEEIKWEGEREKMRGKKRGRKIYMEEKEREEVLYQKLWSVLYFHSYRGYWLQSYCGMCIYNPSCWYPKYEL